MSNYFSLGAKFLPPPLPEEEISSLGLIPEALQGKAESFPFLRPDLLELILQPSSGGLESAHKTIVPPGPYGPEGYKKPSVVEKPVVEGVTDIVPAARLQVPERTGETPLTDVQQSLLSRVGEASDAIKRIKIGDTEIEGITPADMLKGQPSQVGGTFPLNTQAGGVPGLVSPQAGVEGATPGWREKLNTAIQDPRFAYVMGGFGQAVAPYSPGIQQLGEMNKLLAQQKAFKSYQEELQKPEGERDLTQGQFGLISPQQRLAAGEEARKATREPLETEKLTAETESILAGVDLKKAQTEGVLTAEERKGMEQTKQAIELAIASMNDETRRKIAQAEGLVAAGKGEKVNAALEKHILNLSYGPFLEIAKANKKASLPKDKQEMFDFDQFFGTRDDVRWEVVNQWLPPEMKGTPAQHMQMYSMGLQQNIAPSMMFKGISGQVPQVVPDPENPGSFIVIKD